MQAGKEVDKQVDEQADRQTGKHRSCEMSKQDERTPCKVRRGQQTKHLTKQPTSKQTKKQNTLKGST